MGNTFSIPRHTWSPIIFFHLFFFFNDPATTEIYTLSLHDALPILRVKPDALNTHAATWRPGVRPRLLDRKSTRLNSSYRTNSYAVFCLKKKTIMHNISELDKQKITIGSLIIISINS